MYFFFFNCLGHIVVTVLPPINTTGLNLDHMAELMDKTHMSMDKVFKDTSDELMRNLEFDRSYPV